MSAFSYLAVDEQGVEKKGVMEADNDKQARHQLRSEGLLPLEINPVQDNKSVLWWQTKRRISGKTLALLTRQLATLVQAQIPLVEALATVAKQLPSASARTVILSVRSEVLAGHPLAEGLAQFPTIFPSLYRATVAAGERSGHLAQVLMNLADYVESQLQTQQKLQQALIYPVLMSLVSLGVLSFLLAYVVPKIINVFTQSHQRLPWVTQVLLQLSSIAQHDGLFILCALLLLIGGFRYGLTHYVSWQRRWHNFLLNIPIVGYYLKLINTARFIRTLGLLHAAGVPILESLQVATAMIANQVMHESVEQSCHAIAQGHSIYHALSETGYFSPMGLQLIASGERGGCLDDMLARAAQYHEQEIHRAIDTGLALFEPLMILCMGAVVLFIVLAVLLPIFSLDQLTNI